MTEDEAMVAVGHLVGGLNGFTEDSVLEYAEQFETLPDAGALDDVCRELARTWQDRWRPTVADVITRYHAHPRVRDEREARVAESMLDESGGGLVPYSEGQVIARDAYRGLYGREMGEPAPPNPEYAETLIVNRKQRDRHGNWLARYGDVVKGFRGDQARARVSLKAIGSRLTHDDYGHLTLKPPTQELPSHLPAVEAPADRPPDPSGLLTEALGITRSRMENRDG